MIDRTTILEESRDLLIRDGFSNLSMRKIAQRLGVSATALYSHFESKDDLLLSLIDTSVETLIEILNEAASQSSDAIDRLRKIAQAYVHFGLDRSQEYEIIFAVRPEQMPRYPKEKFRRVRSAYELLADTIRQGNEEGILDENEPELAAYAIWAELHGVISVILNQRLDAKIPTGRFVSFAIDHVVDGFVSRRSTLQDP